MLKVIRPGKLVSSGQVVQIPDISPPVQCQAVEEEIQSEPSPSVEQSRQILEENSLKQAEEISRKILQSAREERQKILDNAQAEAQRLREQACEEGRSSAREAKRQDIEACLSQLNALMDELQQEQQAFLRQYEDGLSSLALDIAEKIIGNSIREHPNEMLELVQKAVSSVKNVDWISVNVSEKMPALVEQLKKELPSWTDAQHTDVVASDLPVDSCVIHTPNGVVDASVSTQIGNLKSLFQNIG